MLKYKICIVESGEIVRGIKAENLVFIDESGVNKRNASTRC